MNKTILILDIDGVLITTPLWKADEIDSDGYSKFNNNCVDNLNKLLSHSKFEIWLSSTRRALKSIEEFQIIFKNRNIHQKIEGFLPVYENCKTRKDEILKFIKEFKTAHFLIIDDDKSLNSLEKTKKDKLVLTDFQKGFDKEKLKVAMRKIEASC